MIVKQFVFCVLANPSPLPLKEQKINSQRNNFILFFIFFRNVDARFLLLSLSIIFQASQTFPRKKKKKRERF